MRWDLGGRLCSLHSRLTSYFVEKKEKGQKDSSFELNGWNEITVIWTLAWSAIPNFRLKPFRLSLLVRVMDLDESGQQIKSQIVAVFFLPKCHGPHRASVRWKVKFTELFGRDATCISFQTNEVWLAVIIFFVWGKKYIIAWPVFSQFSAMDLFLA